MVQHQQGVTATSQAVPASTYSNDLYSSSQRLQEQQFHLKLLPPQTNTHISYSYTISGCKGNTSNYSWRSDTCEPSSLSHMFISSSTSLDNNKMIRACQPAFPHQQDIPATTARNNATTTSAMLSTDPLLRRAWRAVLEDLRCLPGSITYISPPIKVATSTLQCLRQQITTNSLFLHFTVCSSRKASPSI